MLDRLSAIYVVANQELATVKSAVASGRDAAGAIRTRRWPILSRTDRHAEIGREDIEKAVGSTSVAHAFPSDYRVALQALNKGAAVALDNHNELSASFKRFAHRPAGRIPPVTRAARRAVRCG